MALENKLGITNSAELTREEEKISKAKALELFEAGMLEQFEIGTFREWLPWQERANDRSLKSCAIFSPESQLWAI